MPELAEVEFYRRQWDAGVGRRVVRVNLHGGKRVFRQSRPRALARALAGAKLVDSATHGKQILFRFTNDSWLGVHLGMTGELRLERIGFSPGRHDHLVLWQPRQALVFRDPRQFGRIRFHQGSEPPSWWSNLPPSPTSPEFTLAVLEKFLQRHRKAPIKAVLLSQQGFPGVGNWMADEILWRARVHPRLPAAQLNSAERRTLWHAVRLVCREALRIIGRDFSDPPGSWLFSHRWENGGRCPKHGVELAHCRVGGRRTVWCPKCQ